MAKVTITITDVPAIRKKEGLGSATIDYAFDPPITDDTENTAALHIAQAMITAARALRSGDGT